MSFCLKAVFSEFAEEFHRSVEKHGDWQGYGPVEVRAAVAGEFNEYTAAFVAGDVHGEHGQSRELLQLAVVALKGHMRLKRVNVG